MVAAKDLNLAEFFAQAAARASSLPAWQAANQRADQSAGQLAGDGSEPGSEQASDPPERLPDSVMPQSWLDALDELEDDAKTAYDAPEQLPALTDAAILHLTAMDDPTNPGTPIVQTCAFGGGGSSGSGSSGSGSDKGGAQQEDRNWWNGSGWWWLNLWSYPLARHAINYCTGYYDALDRAKELDVARQARDSNRILRAGDIPSLTQGVSQWEAAARAESEIKRFGRDRIADAAYIAGGEIIGMAGAGGFADDAAKAAASGRTGRNCGELIKDVTSNPSKWQIVKKEIVASTNMRNKGGWSIQELLRNSETGEEIVRHTLLKPDGTLFEVPHFRPFWK